MIFFIHNFEAKPLNIRFDKVNGFIRVYDEARYLVLFRPEKYDLIYNKIRYVIRQKSCITYVFFFFHYYAKIIVDSYDYLPVEKGLDLDNVIILIRPVFNKIKITIIIIYS